MSLTKQQEILLIEDDPPLARVYELYLKEEPYQVVHVGTGKEALDSIRKCPPEGIVLDLHLPDMDGLEILKFILKVFSPLTLSMASRDRPGLACFARM